MFGFIKKIWTLGGIFDAPVEEEQMSQEEWDSLSWRDQEMYNIIQRIESLKKRHRASKSRAYLGMATHDSTMSNSAIAQMSSYEIQINQLNQTYCELRDAAEKEDNIVGNVTIEAFDVEAAKCKLKKRYPDCEILNVS